VGVCNRENVCVLEKWILALATARGNSFISRGDGVLVPAVDGFRLTRKRLTNTPEQNVFVEVHGPMVPMQVAYGQ